VTEEQRSYEQKDQDLVFDEFSGNDTRQKRGCFSYEMPKHFSFGQFAKLPFLGNLDTKTWGMLFT